MILSTITAYLPYVLITTFTPGPNNLISFYAVSSYGWKKASRVLLGIGSAILMIMVITALFCHQLSEHLPAVLPYFKYFGAAYILWLAIQIGKSSPDDSTFNVVTFWKGFVLVFINIKMLLYAVTVFTGYIMHYSTDLSVLLLHALLLTFLCVLSNITWGAAGRMLQKVMAKHYRIFNVIMALILIYCAITLII